MPTLTVSIRLPSLRPRQTARPLHSLEASLVLLALSMPRIAENADSIETISPSRVGCSHWCLLSFPLSLSHSLSLSRTFCRIPFIDIYMPDELSRDVS